jgi:hypothetical protein
MVEPAGIGHRRLKRILPGVAERRVAEIVSETERLRQVLVESKGAGHRAADLRDFDAMGQADAVVIAVRRDEDLRLVTKTPEGDGVNNPVAIALENVTRAARRPVGFRMGPAAGCAGVRGKCRGHSLGNFLIVWPGRLVHVKASM